MMQHDQQETQQTILKPRQMVHERIRALAEGASKFETVFQVVTAIRVMANLEEMRWNEGMEALAADLQAIEAQDGWVGELTTEQWERVEAAIHGVLTVKAMALTQHGNQVHPAAFIECVKAALEQQEGDSPS